MGYPTPTVYHINMEDIIGLEEAAGLSPDSKKTLTHLVEIFTDRWPKNRVLTNYFENKVPVKTIGIDNVPEQVRRVAQAKCDWASKAVTAISERVRLDGFVFTGDSEEEEFQSWVKDTGLCEAYNQVIDSQLVHGCAFATIDITEEGIPRVFFHAADSAAGIWDDYKRALKCGFAITARDTTPWSPTKRIPTRVHLYESHATTVLKRVDASNWVAEEYPHALERPLIELLAFRPTGMKPLGQSRITPTVRWLVDDTQRTLLYMAITGAIYSTPLMAALGLSETQYEAMSAAPAVQTGYEGASSYGDKMETEVTANDYFVSGWVQKAGSWFLATRDEDGNMPDLEMFSGQSPQPYIDLVSTNAKFFSGATGVPLNSLGIVQDNPSSAEAIEAAREDICTAAEDLIDTNRPALQRIAKIALAFLYNLPIEDLDETQKSVLPRFKNPSRPSLAATADAMVKIAGVVEGFSSTKEFWSGMGFDLAEVESITTQIRQAQARQQAQALAAQAANNLLTQSSTTVTVEDTTTEEEGEEGEPAAGSEPELELEEDEGAGNE